jgi:hypothetical protein
MKGDGCGVSGSIYRDVQDISLACMSRQPGSRHAQSARALVLDHSPFTDFEAIEYVDWHLARQGLDYPHGGHMLPQARQLNLSVFVRFLAGPSL